MGELNRDALDRRPDCYGYTGWTREACAEVQHRVAAALGVDVLERCPSALACTLRRELIDQIDLPVEAYRRRIAERWREERL